VHDDLRAKLLLPFLSHKAKSVISRLYAEELEDYEGVRDFILSEFKLTPREYKSRFDNATKRSDETYILFAARYYDIICRAEATKFLGSTYTRSPSAGRRNIHNTTPLI